VTLPGLATISGGTPVYVPYAIPESATWTLIVTRLGLTTAEAQVGLMTDNADTPDLLMAGVKITIGSDDTTTTDRSTFHSVLDDLNRNNGHHSYADLMTVIAGKARLMRRGGAMAVALPAIPPATSLADVAANFGLTAEALAVANAALSPLIAAGQEIKFTTPKGDNKTVTTRTNDSFATIAARFAAQELTVSVARPYRVLATERLYGVTGSSCRYLLFF